MTLSITGRCPRTGHLGLAISSHDLNFSPALIDELENRPHSQAVAGTGAIAAQANTRPGFSAIVMDLLWQGSPAPEALARSLCEEDGDTRERFQIAVVDGAGRCAAFTGETTFDCRGHKVGDGWVAAGNILAEEQVIDATGASFEANADLPLDERLVTALTAGVEAGGDRRGHRSAYLRVATGEAITELEIRVHEHIKPARELRRLLALHHQECDFTSAALRAAAAIRALCPESELQRFGEMNTYLAVKQLRDLIAGLDAPAESLESVDRILCLLPERPDMADARFADVLRILPV